MVYLFLFRQKNLKDDIQISIKLEFVTNCILHKLVNEFKQEDIFRVTITTFVHTYINDKFIDRIRSLYFW